MTFSRKEIIAAQNGYRAMGIAIIGPSGKSLRLLLNDAGYPMFSMSVNGQSKKVRAHRLAAYQKFGEQLFTPGLEVRHLDGNRQNFLPDNLKLGTKSQNAMDKAPEVRRRVAGNAARKHDPIAVRAFFAECKSYPLTMAHFNITSTGTLHYVLNKAATH